jgi:hypothetical protein
MIEDEDRPLFHRQPVQGVIQEVGVHVGSGLGDDRSLPREVDPGDRDLANAATTACPQCHSRSIDGDPLKPRIELLGLAQARQLSPGRYERLLGAS